MRKRLLAFVAILLAVVSAHALPADSCDCPSSTCAPCEIETGTTFYSAKCGASLEKVKSCKKATCEAVENQPQCLAMFKAIKKEDRFDTGSAADQPKGNEREIANTAPEAGQITDVSGEVKVLHANGTTEKPRKRDTAYVGDLYETKGDGRVKIVLRDESEMTIAPESRIKIEKVDVNLAVRKRQIALQVLAGKLRNKVQKEYKGDNFYQVKTRTAVAGVRGTDFITSFEPNKTEWVSEIRTIEGLVKLQSTKANLEDGVAVSVEVPAGTYASVANDAPASGASEAEIDALAAQARVSPLYKIKDEDLKKLKEGLEFLVSEAVIAKAPVRSIASESSDELCQAPAGRYNQCSWTCEHNPAGEKKCRTDLPEVTCVRRLCRANGAWTEEKRLPATEGERCQPGHAVVHSCESYW